MSKPERIRLSRAKGWCIPENTVVVSRPSAWGNPFVVGKDGTRAECVKWFAYMLNGYMPLCLTPEVDEMKAYRAFASENLHTLKGKNLACWCALPKPGERDECHAAVLLDLANRSKAEARRVAREHDRRRKAAEGAA